MTTFSESLHLEEEAEGREEVEHVRPGLKRSRRAPGKSTKEAKRARLGPGIKEARKSAGAVSAVLIAQSRMISSARGPTVKKGRGVIDRYSGLQQQAHILEEGDTVWMCTLNQTNIDAERNNNKFYIIQVIEDDGGGRCWVWNRWGRVGQVGNSKLLEFRSVELAKQDFRKKFLEKTLNQWQHREHFVKHDGKYQLMDIDYGDDPDEDVQFNNENEQESELDPRVRKLMELVTDRQNMRQVMKDLKIDLKRMPLGKVSRRQLAAGYSELQKIERELRDLSEGLGGDRMKRIEAASSQFYTLIPHDVGYDRLPPIATHDLLERKQKMLEALSALEVTVRVLSGVEEDGHPLDIAYRRLGVQVMPLPKSSGEWKLVESVVESTHGPTHKGYKLEVADLFELQTDAKPSTDRSQSMLLWHGSRAANWAGILSKGLRIAPPEAPVTGYMFGKGVYFADCVSKSANYCHCSPGKNEGLVLLSEVDVGVPHDCFEAEAFTQPPPGCQSVRGVGRNTPSAFVKPEGPGGPQWPQGPLQEAKLEKASSLLYNEYVVYNVSQIRPRYVVRLRFNY
eukprot:Hpha_TRINITY_DN16343_c0_g3::TRINITY_DN16343_c0_g3_i1::g.58996::m.58996/K10798/PARP; poly [ADP-ribose] polymerase